MRFQWKLPQMEKVQGFFKQYRYVLLVAAAGALLLLWPAGEEGRQPAAEETGLAGAEEDFDLEALEERLAAALSRIEGAGEVSVVLTVISLGLRVVLAYLLSAIPAVGVTGIWWSVPIGWMAADLVGYWYADQLPTSERPQRKKVRRKEGRAHTR